MHLTYSNTILEEESTLESKLSIDGRVLGAASPKVFLSDPLMQGVSQPQEQEAAQGLKPHFRDTDFSWLHVPSNCPLDDEDQPLLALRVPVNLEQHWGFSSGFTALTGKLRTQVTSTKRRRRYELLQGPSGFGDCNCNSYEAHCNGPGTHRKARGNTLEPMMTRGSWRNKGDGLSTSPGHQFLTWCPASHLRNWWTTKKLYTTKAVHPVKGASIHDGTCKRQFSKCLSP